MPEVEQCREQLPRMRAGLAVGYPHPGPLPEGEGEKWYALLSSRVSIITMRRAVGRDRCGFLRRTG